MAANPADVADIAMNNAAIAGVMPDDGLGDIGMTLKAGLGSPAPNMAQSFATASCIASLIQTPTPTPMRQV